MSRPRLLVVGGTPPPVHGTSLFIRMLLDDPHVAARFDVSHLETADRRGLGNIGRLDATNIRLGLAHLVALHRTLRRQRPDLVYLSVSQNAWAYLRDSLFILAATRAGARVITHLHGGYFGEFRRRARAPLRWWIGFTQRRVHRAWVLGEGLRDCYRGIVPSQRVRVAPNGVPDLLEDIGSGQARSPDDGPPTILVVGQLSAAKGLLDLLDAAALLVASGHAFELLVAGAWASEADLRQAQGRIEALGLSERARLPGVVEGREKALAFARARVFVLPTRYPLEGQPLAVLEAMAAGIPVVATPRAAIPDMVIDGETGLLVPEGDPGHLAAAVASLLEDAPRARRMGAAARARYLDRFTLETCMERVAELLDEALEESALEDLSDASHEGSKAPASA